MMARKDRFPVGFSAVYSPNYRSEGSGSSDRVVTELAASENSRAPKRKLYNLNFGRRDILGVPTQVLPLSKMRPAERKNLVLRLKAELEQIRVFHRRVEMQRTNSIALSSSSDILSGSNIGKSALPDSAPARNVNPPDNKAGGWNRGTSGRFESAVQPEPSSANTVLMKQCEALLKKLMQHQYGWVFNTPVDVVKLNIPDYFTVIKHPMDLGTIKRKIETGEYSSPLDFAADVRLTFSNAMTYNPRGNDVHLMADELKKFFEVRWRVIQKKIAKESQPVEQKSGVYGEKEAVQPTPPSKKRKVASMHHKTLQKAAVRKMTNEEKLKLSGELEELLGELPDNIVDFLKDQTLHGRETGVEEIEIDIDVLSDDTLFKLRKLLDDYIHEKQKNQAKAEPCEIELLNDSGPSNSSMLLYKGNDPVDEDIDIGGNEPPVSSCPPVKIDHDTGHRSTSNGHSDLDSSNSGKEPSDVKASSLAKPTKENSGPEADVDGNTESVSGLEQPEINSENLNSVNSDWLPDGESAGNERQLSPERLYRAAILKKRFADTILKAREKKLVQGEKGDPDQMRRAREELELQKKKEKARLHAEARAAEDARRRAEAMAEAEAKRKRDLEREAARQALQMMEKTVEINENSRFLEDLEMLRAVPPEQLPSSADEASPEQSHDALGSFSFRGSNALEQLGLFMKLDEDEEEGEPQPRNIAHIVDDVEEGEVDEVEGKPPKNIPSIVDDVEEGEMGEGHEEGERPNNIPSSIDDVEEGEMDEGHEVGDPPNNVPSCIDVEEGKMGNDHEDGKPLNGIFSIADHFDLEAEKMDEDPRVGASLDNIPSADDVDMGQMDEDHEEGGSHDNNPRIVCNAEEGEMGKDDKEGGLPNNIPSILNDVEVGEVHVGHEQGGSLNDSSRIVDYVEEGEMGKDGKEGDTRNNIPSVVDGVNIGEMDISRIVDDVEEWEMGKVDKQCDASDNILSTVGDMNEICGSLNDISRIVDNVEEGEMGKDVKECDSPNNIPNTVDEKGDNVGEMAEDHEKGGPCNDILVKFDNEEGEMGKDNKEGDTPHTIPSIVDDVGVGEMNKDHEKSDVSRIVNNVEEEEMGKVDKEGNAANNILRTVDDVNVMHMPEDHEEGGMLHSIPRIINNVEEVEMDKDNKEDDVPCNIPSIVDVGDMHEDHKENNISMIFDYVGNIPENYPIMVDDVKGEMGEDGKGQPPCEIPSIVDDVEDVEID